MSESWPITAATIGERRRKGSAEPFQLAMKGIETLAIAIAEGPLAERLFGWTSMFDLCVQQTDAHPYSCAYLRVSALPSGAVELRYIDTAIRDRQWHREVPPEAVVAMFAAFLDQRHW